MSKGTHRLVLPFLLALGLAFSGSPVGAATRFELPPAAARSTGGWLSKFLVHLSFALGRSGNQIDPNGGSDPNKNGFSVDPNGQPKPNKNGLHIDPNGRPNPNKSGFSVDPDDGKKP